MPLDDSTDTSASRPGAPKSPLGEDARQHAAHLGQTAQADIPGIPPVIGAAGTAGSDFDERAAAALRNAKERRAKRRRKRLVKIGVFAGILVLAVVGITVARNLAAGSQVTPPSTATVTRADFETTVNASAKAQPLSSTVVTPEVEGIIESVSVSEGAEVSEGDVLLTLRSDELEKGIRDANQGVAARNNALSAAQSSFDRAWEDYEKALDAWNSAPSAEAQASLTNPDVAYRAAVDAQNAVDSARLELESANSAYSDAVAKAAKRTVKAPCSGSVVAMNAVVGAAVGQGSGGGQGSSGPLIQIADISQMKVNAQVNEADISNLAVGQTATVTFSAVPDAIMDATVTRIATVSTGSGDNGSGVVTYTVELLIPSPDARIKPGMTASASIKTQSIPAALTLPSGAVMTDESGNPYVEVVKLSEDGMSVVSSETKQVKVIAKNSTDTVVEGVNEGDVVLNGAAGSEGTGAGTDAGAAL